MKGQSSLEFVSIITLALVLSTPLIITSQSSGASFLGDVTALQFDNSLSNIVDKTDRSRSIGAPVVLAEDIRVPQSVESSNKVTDNSFQYFSRDSGYTYSAVFSGEFKVTQLPVNDRQYEMRIINLDGQPWITRSEHVDYVEFLNQYGNYSYNSEDVPAQNEDFQNMPNQIGEDFLSLDGAEFKFDTSNDVSGFEFIESQGSGASASIDVEEEMSLFIVVKFADLESSSSLLELDDLFELKRESGQVILESEGEETSAELNKESSIIGVEIEEDNLNLYVNSESAGDITATNDGQSKDLDILNGATDSDILKEFVILENASSNLAQDYLDSKYIGD